MMWLPILILGGGILYWINHPNARKPSSGENKAETILMERFAKGEIDEATYRLMKEVLNK